MKYLNLIIALGILSGCADPVYTARVQYTCKDNGGPMIPNPVIANPNIICNDGSVLPVKKVIKDPSYWYKPKGN